MPPTIPAIPPVAAAKHVVTHTNEMSSGSALRTEPPLKPNHPNHSKKTPITASGAEELPNVIDLPSTYFPIRGPRTITAAKAAHPPTE